MPLKINIDWSQFKKTNKYHAVVSNEIVGEDFIFMLRDKGLSIDWVEVFYLAPNTNHTIHCDGIHQEFNFGKINYIVGGKDSVMSWYIPKNNKKGKIQKTKAGTSYMTLDVEDAIEVFSENVHNFYLVNVSNFHTVWNKLEDRFCLSAYVKNSTTNMKLSFTELQKEMSEFL